MHEITSEPGDEVVAIPRWARLKGIEVESLGRTWTLGILGLAPGFDDERDELYEDVTLTEKVSMDQIFNAGYAMLLLNYKADEVTIGRILAGVDRKELIEAVVTSLMPTDCPEHWKGISYWARTALLANGLDPAKIGAENIAGVLAHLVGTKRALPDTEFTRAGMFVSTRNELLG